MQYTIMELCSASHNIINNNNSNNSNNDKNKGIDNTTTNNSKNNENYYKNNNSSSITTTTLHLISNNNNNNLYYNSPYGFSLSLSVVLILGLYRPSSEPIALRNVLKCPTRHTLHIIRFWHFSSAVIITKNAKNAVLRQFAFSR